LRAPLDAQIARAHALVAIGEGNGAAVPLAAAKRYGLATFAARLAPDAADVAALARRPVLAFAGIGDPEKFFATLARADIDVRARRAFADHHPYSRADADTIIAEAKAGGLTPVTTEKDMMRLAGQPETAALAAAARTLAVTLAVADQAGFADLVRRVAR
jgi:tetraacyldisaccharide 4'-kinase